MNAHDYTITVDNKRTCERIEFCAETLRELEAIESLLLFLNANYSITAPDGSEYMTLIPPEEE